MSESSLSTPAHGLLGAGNACSDNETQFLALKRDDARIVWYKTRVNKLFIDSIEWVSLCTELVETHDKWFNAEELSKVSECNSSCKEAISTALQRNPQDVLQVLYKSLCATQGRGGATMHDTVAEEVVKIMKDVTAARVQQTLTATPASINPPRPYRSNSSPSNPQLASAEPDTGRHGAQAQVTDTTGHQVKAFSSLEKQTSFPAADEGMRARLNSQEANVSPQASAKFRSQFSRASSDAASPLPSSSSPLVQSNVDRRQARRDCHEDSPQAEATRSTSGVLSVKKDVWEGIVDLIQKHLRKKDVLCSLSTEMLGVKGHQLVCSHPSEQQLSEALQAAVTERRMKWFEFAQYLLRSKSTRRFVFEIASYTKSSIPSQYKKVLTDRLGSSWYDLAIGMGLPKGHIDGIKLQCKDDLLGQVDTFLERYKLPSFGTHKDTTRFLVETLEKVNLSDVAAAVERDLMD